MLIAEQRNDRPDRIAFAGDSTAGSYGAFVAAPFEGLRPVVMRPGAAALLAIGWLGRGDVALIEAVAGEEDALAECLDQLEQAARTRDVAGVVIVPRDLIDLATGRISAPAIEVLAEPTDLEREIAIALAFRQTRTGLYQTDDDAVARRLRQLSEEVGRIARSLAALSIAEPAPRAPIAGAHEGRKAYGAPGDGKSPVKAAQIRAMIRARRLRDQYFEAEMFADPAWDMLLDLTAARLEGRRVSVSSLCIAAAVPPTTGLRWIKLLTEQGLFVRVSDPQDGRRVFIALDDATAEAMLRFLGDATRLGVMPV